MNIILSLANFLAKWHLATQHFVAISRFSPTQHSSSPPKKQSASDAQAPIPLEEQIKDPCYCSYGLDIHLCWTCQDPAFSPPQPRWSFASDVFCPRSPCEPYSFFTFAPHEAFHFLSWPILLWLSPALLPQSPFPQCFWSGRRSWSFLSRQRWMSQAIPPSYSRLGSEYQIWRGYLVIWTHHFCSGFGSGYETHWLMSEILMSHSWPLPS